MINAALVAMEINSHLPTLETPANTDGYEGFYHLTDMKGSVEHATLAYIVRDHSAELFAARLAEYGVSVIEIRPGIIETDMTSKVKEKYEKLIAEGITPINRMGKPEDVAKCVVSVAEGNFDFCTGTVIDCDGGFNVRRL